MPHFVAPLVKGIARGANAATGKAHGGAARVDFLAASFYGGDGRGACERKVEGHHCGYDPALGGLTAQGLHYLQALAPAKLANASLQLFEYGCLGNSEGVVSPEPGAFGGAWTLASSLQAAAGGVSRAYHWGIGEVLMGRHLWFGNAFVTSAAIKLFGRGGGSGATMAGPARILTGTSSRVDTLPTIDVNGVELSASGLAGWVKKSPDDLLALAVLVSVFTTQKSSTATATVELRFDCPQQDAAWRCDAAQGLEVKGWWLDAASGPHDILRADAARNGWLKNPAAAVPNVNTAKNMLNAQGFAAVEKNATKYLDAQAALFAKAPLAGARATCSGAGKGGCVLTVTAAQAPTVVAAWISPA